MKCPREQYKYLGGGGAKVPYFFISQEKFKFVHFLGKIELVSKKAVFFFPSCFFFPALEFELVSTI